MNKKKHTLLLVIVLLTAAAFLVISPLFFRKNADFGGSDDKGNTLIETTDPDYEPWATPALEKLLGRELPAETETLLFCVQTGIGVGIIAFLMGRLVERKKWQKNTGEKDSGGTTLKEQEQPDARN